MSFYIDLSEFLGNPIRTGIQRIAGELCKHLPRSMARPLRFHGGRYVSLPPDLIDAIGGYFNDTGESGLAEILRLGAVANGSAVDLSERDIVLVPEVFDNPERVRYLRDMPDEKLRRFRFIVYDLLPGTHPEYFHTNRLVHVYAYFKILRRATRAGFISEDSRDIYYSRLKRTLEGDGVVLPLGSDGLGPKGSRLTLNRSPVFSVIGTIEPRKNHHLILEAFEPLLGRVDGLNLFFIGRMGWIDPDFANRIQALSSDEKSGFRFCPAPNDGAVRHYMEQSRATIYVSSAEGYGLPPVESLWIGTPVIASTTIPSLKRLGSAGIRYVDPLNVLNLRRAIVDFLDDNYANEKTAETASLSLPTWASFAKEVCRWCEQR